MTLLNIDFADQGSNVDKQTVAKGDHNSTFGKKVGGRNKKSWVLLRLALFSGHSHQSRQAKFIKICTTNPHRRPKHSLPTGVLGHLLLMSKFKASSGFVSEVLFWGPLNFIAKPVFQKRIFLTTAQGCWSLEAACWWNCDRYLHYLSGNYLASVKFSSFRKWAFSTADKPRGARPQFSQQFHGRVSSHWSLLGFWSSIFQTFLTIVLYWPMLTLSLKSQADWLSFSWTNLCSKFWFLAGELPHSMVTNTAEKVKAKHFKQNMGT